MLYFGKIIFFRCIKSSYPDFDIDFFILNFTEEIWQPCNVLITLLTSGITNHRAYQTPRVMNGSIQQAPWLSTHSLCSLGERTTLCWEQRILLRHLVTSNTLNYGFIDFTRICDVGYVCMSVEDTKNYWLGSKCFNIYGKQQYCLPCANGYMLSPTNMWNHRSSALSEWIRQIAFKCIYLGTYETWIKPYFNKSTYLHNSAILR